MGLANTTTNLSYARNELIKVGESFIFDKVADMIWYMMTNDDISTTSTAPLTVGEDGAGEDVKFYGDTSGVLWEWDADDNRAEITNGRIQVLTTDDKTAAFNAIYSYIDTGGSTGWTTGNVVAGRFKLNIDGTSSAGDATALWAGLVWAGSLARNGLAVAMNVELTTTAGNNAPNAILYIQSLPGTNADHSGLPYIVFTETETGTGSNILFECGHVPAGTTVTSGSGKLFNTTTLQIKVNGTAKFIPLSTTENTLTTAGNVALTGTLTTGASGTGVDTKFWGDTALMYWEWDADLDTMNVVGGWIKIGSQGSGTVLTTTYPNAMEIHAKPTSALTAGENGVSCGLRCRYEVGGAQTNQIGLMAIHALLRPKFAMADGLHAGINAGIETDAMAFTGTSTTQRTAGCFYLDFAASTTLTSGWLTGVVIDSSLEGAIDVSSVTFAGLRIKTSSTKEPWTYGIYASGMEMGLYALVEPTGAAHKKSFEWAVTDATTTTGGYNASFFVEVTNTGAMAPTEYTGSRFNLILNTGAKSGVINALKAKIGTSSAPTLTSATVNGLHVSMDEIGTCARFNCMLLETTNTTNTDNSAFFDMRSQGAGLMESVFYHSGTNRPLYFWRDNQNISQRFAEAGDITSGKACTGGFRCLFGSTVVVIPFYAD